MRVPPTTHKFVLQRKTKASNSLIMVQRDLHFWVHVDMFICLSDGLFWICWHLMKSIQTRKQSTECCCHLLPALSQSLGRGKILFFADIAWHCDRYHYKSSSSSPLHSNMSLRWLKSGKVSLRFSCLLLVLFTCPHQSYRNNKASDWCGKNQLTLPIYCTLSPKWRKHNAKLPPCFVNPSCSKDSYAITW